MNQLNATSAQRLSNAVAAGTSRSTPARSTWPTPREPSFGCCLSDHGGGGHQRQASGVDDNGSVDDWSDLEGSSVSVADTDDNKMVEIELAKPRKRYARVVVSRATQNAVVDGITAIPTACEINRRRNTRPSLVARSSSAPPKERRSERTPLAARRKRQAVCPTVTRA